MRLSHRTVIARTLVWEVRLSGKPGVEIDGDTLVPEMQPPLSLLGRAQGRPD
jgi:hypothetical protein